MESTEGWRQGHSGNKKHWDGLEGGARKLQVNPKQGSFHRGQACLDPNAALGYQLEMGKNSGNQSASFRAGINDQADRNGSWHAPSCQPPSVLLSEGLKYSSRENQVILNGRNVFSHAPPYSLL